MRARRRSVEILAFALMLCGIPLASNAAPPGADSADQPRGLAAANGLLGRGLNELAAREYAEFLSAHAEHADAPIARYGLAVADFRMGKLADAEAELNHLEDLNDFKFRAEVLVMLGQCRMASGETAEAIAPLREMITRFASHPLADDAAAILIESEYRSAKYADAMQTCHSFLKDWSDSPGLDRALYFGGLAAVNQNEDEVAVEWLQLLRDRAPRSPCVPHATLILGQTLLSQSRLKPASECFASLLSGENSPYQRAASIGLATADYQGGNVKAAIQRLRSIAESGQPLDDQSLLLLGRAEFDNGDYEDAATTLAKIPSSAPTRRDAEYLAAKCLLRTGKYKDAARTLANLLEKAGESAARAEMKYDLAVAQYRADQFDDAATTLGDFRRSHPDHPLSADALKLAASVEYARRNFADSERLSKQYLDDYGGAAGADALFLSAESAYLQERFAEAADAYRAFLKSQKGDARADIARYRLGLALYQLKQFDDAAKELSMLPGAESDPSKFPLIHFVLGDIAFARENWEVALKEFDRHLKSPPKSGGCDDALLKSGLALVRLDRTSDAVERFSRLLEQFKESPHRIQALFERGQCRLQSNSLDDAAADFNSVVAADPEGRFTPAARRHLASIAMTKGDYAAAAEGFAAVAKHTKDSNIEADALYREGLAQLAAGDFNSAQRSLEKLLDRFPGDSKANNSRAHLIIVLARQKSFKDALAQFGKLNSTDLSVEIRRQVRYELAWCHRSIEQLDQAKADYRDLLTDGDDNPIALNALVEWAEIESDGGNCDEVINLIKRFESALEKSNSPADEALAVRANYRLGVCQFKSKRFDEAAAALKGLSLQSRDESLANSAAYFRGEALFELGSFDEAAREFERIAKEPTAASEAAIFSSALLRLGECQSKLQRWSAAEESFARYLERFTDSDAWYQAEFGRGWARENQGRFNEAIKCYRKVVDRHQGPTAARSQFQIGQCLFAEKKLPEAARELMKVDILYAYPEWSAAALYEAGRCFEQMHQGAEARTQFKTVVEKYKDSRWADMAAERLAALADVSIPGRG